jgi:hypothetical protein
LSSSWTRSYSLDALIRKIIELNIWKLPTINPVNKPNKVK